jgi:hypothetical protein
MTEFLAAIAGAIVGGGIAAVLSFWRSEPTSRVLLQPLLRD